MSVVVCNHVLLYAESHQRLVNADYPNLLSRIVADLAVLLWQLLDFLVKAD